MRLSFGGAQDEAEKCREQQHCICKSKSTSAFMICCDYCDIWYHGACVEVTRALADRIDKYSCPLCISVSPSRVTVLKNYLRTPPRSKKSTSCITPRKSAQKTRTPNRSRNSRKHVDFSECDGAAEATTTESSMSSHDVSNRNLTSPMRMLAEEPMSWSSCGAKAVTPSAASRIEAPSTRFSISPEKRAEPEEGLPTTGVINYIGFATPITNAPLPTELTSKMTPSTPTVISCDMPLSVPTVSMTTISNPAVSKVVSPSPTAVKMSDLTPSKATVPETTTSEDERFETAVPEAMVSAPNADAELTTSDPFDSSQPNCALSEFELTPSDLSPVKESTVLNGYFMNFRERNGYALKLNDFLEEESGDESDCPKHAGKHSRLDKKSSKTNEISPDKKVNRRLINIPETPEEKLQQRSQSAVAIVVENNENEEVVPQTPIGKIRRESVGGKSRLNILLNENSSDAAPSTMNGGSRKRHLSPANLRANSAKRSLF